MAIEDYQALVDSLVRDDSGRVSIGDRDGALALALERYSQDRPRDAVEDIVAAGSLINLPTGWQADFSALLDLEYPVGKVPPRMVDREGWSLYRGPAGQQIMVLAAINGTVRARYTIRHQLTSALDTIPTQDREAVAKYAASLVCDQLASMYSSDTDSTLGADRTQGQTRAQAFAARGREYRKQYQAALGIDDKKAVSAGAVVQLKSTDSAGQPYLFHPPRRRLQ